MRCSFWCGIAVTAAFLMTTTGCGEMSIDGPADADASADVESGDALAEQMIRDKDVAEARAWLAVENNHSLWKTDRATVKPLVEKLYAAGATKVYATGTTPDEDGREMVAMFMAELPTDPATRKKIFEVQTDFWKSYLEDASQEDLEEVSEKDEGQKYLFINFDL